MADGILIQFEKESSLEKTMKAYHIIFIMKYGFISNYNLKVHWSNPFNLKKT